MDAFAAFEQHAFAGQNLGDGNSGGDDGAGILGSIGEKERDHAHAALDVSPGARQAAEPAGGMMKADGGGAGIEGTGVRADDALTEISDLQTLV